MIDIKISSHDAEHYKMHTANVHDQFYLRFKKLNHLNKQLNVLMMMTLQGESYLSQNSHDLKDILVNLLIKQICQILLDQEMNVL